MAGRRRIWLIRLAAALVVVVLLAVIAVKLFVPGRISLEWGPAVPVAKSRAVAEPAEAPPAGPVTATAPEPPRAETASGLHLRYEVPEDLLQREIAALFPIVQDVVGTVKLNLRHPQFVADPDPLWLRLQLELEAVVQFQGREDRYPGRTVARFQVRYDRGGRRVVLSNAELVEFAFTGDAAAVAESLRPVLAESFAAEMNGYEVFRFPDDAGWLARFGIARVQNVFIEGRRVVVIVGP